ncbi:MAG TPA: flippase [Chryseosolibacter sp.]|nr:flippase [Chryseosolibacter sp.]
MSDFISRASRKIKESYWLRSGSYTFMNKICITFFGFINFYILIRVLTKEDFGAWVLFTSIASLMELIKHGFVRNPLIRYLTISSAAESAKIQTASLLLNIIIGLVQVVVLYFCSIYLSRFWSSPQLESLFRIYMISTMLFVPVNHFDVVQQARMEFKGPFLSNLVRNAGLFLFILIVYFFGWSIHLEYFAYAQMTAIFIACFVSFRYARPFLELSRGLDRSWFRELHSYGVFTFGTNVSSMINKSVDSWILGKLISPAAVTIFNPAIRISNLVEVPTDTLTSILFPKLSERIATEGPRAAKYLYEKAVGTITAIMIPVIVFFIVFAGPVIRFVAGPGFAETVPILQITMLYGLIIPANRFMGITLDAIGKAKTNFLFVLRNASINAVSNFFFISEFGIIGAAYGSLTTYVIVVVINQVYMSRFLGVRVSNILKHLLGFYSSVFSGSIKFLKEAR